VVYIAVVLYVGLSEKPRAVVPVHQDLFGLFGLFGFVVYLPALLALALGYRLCLKTFEPGRPPDSRAPILFLRAFEDDDSLGFQPNNAIAKVHGIFCFGELATFDSGPAIHRAKILRLLLNADSHSSEEVLAAAFRNYGPLVAIGRPGETLATAGADRMYVADDQWQTVVTDYLQRSQAVVLQPSQTDGVRWEIQQVLSRPPRRRLLLSLINFKDRPDSFEHFRAKLAAEHGIELSRAIPFQDRPVLVRFRDDGCPIYQPIRHRSELLWTFTGNAVDLPATFGPFIQGLQEGQQSAPQHKEPSMWHGLLSWVLSGLVWGR
jgi:hypothetical protein